MGKSKDNLGKKKTKETNTSKSQADEDLRTSKENKLESADGQIPPKKRKQVTLDNKSTPKITKKEESPKQNFDEDSEDEELRQPTAEELDESEQPQNVLSIETIRQKKKERHSKNIENRKGSLALKEVEKNEQYLRKWENSRSEWKFEKLRQISIQTSIFDETKISVEVWPIALQYLSGSKGAAKEKIIKLAEGEICQMDEEIERTNDKGVMKTCRYTRAREILQNLQ